MRIIEYIICNIMRIIVLIFTIALAFPIVYAIFQMILVVIGTIFDDLTGTTIYDDWFWGN